MQSAESDGDYHMAACKSCVHTAMAGWQARAKEFGWCRAIETRLSFDDWVLATALAGEAGGIVTGDAHLLALDN
jgi:hypothetical protein